MALYFLCHTWMGTVPQDPAKKYKGYGGNDQDRVYVKSREGGWFCDVYV